MSVADQLSSSTTESAPVLPTPDGDIATDPTLGAATTPSTRRRVEREHTIVGATLAGRYRVLERIGAGGMGEVFAAEHTTIGRKVAIKTLGADFRTKPDLVDRFLQEARAASLIDHENIVDITDFGHTDDGAPFFVMEYLDGEDLGRLIRRDGAQPWSRVRGIMLQILAALGAAHGKGIVHRDVKPDNCFRIVRGDNRDFIKVLDFGIAKVIGDELHHRTLTLTGAVIGTAYYMSPEQARSEKLDARADLYSAGVIAFELLTGLRPFTAGGFMGVLSKHLTEPVPPMREVAPDIRVPPGVEALVRRALEKVPDRRWSSAAAFADAIRDLSTAPAAGRTVNAKRVGVAVLVGAAITAGVIAFGTAPEQSATPLGSIAAGTDAITPPNAVDLAPVVGVVGEQAASVASSPVTDSARSELPSAASDDAIAVPVTPARVDDRHEASAARSRKARTKAVAVGASPAAAVDPPKPSSPDLTKGLAAARGVATGCGRKHGGLPGMVVKVRYVIDPDGTVRTAEPLKPLAASPLGKCAAEGLRAQKFPPSENGDTGTVALPVGE